MIKILTYADHERDKVDLIAIAHHLKAINPGSALDTAAGETWSSSKNVHRWSSPAIDRFCSFIRTYTDRPNLELWFNIIGKGGSIDWHNHLNKITGVKSGVYYLTPGNIELKGVSYLTMFSGTVLMFPGDQLHRVEVSQTVERVTLAFNAL